VDNKKTGVSGGDSPLTPTDVHGAAKFDNTTPHSTASNGFGQDPKANGFRTLVNPNALPRELRAYCQFVGWQYVDRGKAKPDKVPVNVRTLGNAGATWPNTWADIRRAVATYQAHPTLAGIGFVLTANDPYVMLDLDDCILDGVPNEFACGVLNHLRTYAELSPSGHGLRLLVHCRHQPNATRRPAIELYSKERFATLTGDVLDDAPIVRLDSLDWFLDQFVPKPEIKPSDPQLSSCVDRAVPSSDQELWDYIRRVNPLAKSIFAGDLADIRNGDHSRAVILMLNSLAMWTSGDAKRMARMIRQTHLDKTKWDENRGGQTWLAGRIDDAIIYMAARGAK